MIEEEVPSVNPKLDAMCEMLKTIHDLNERNKMLEAQIEKMKCCHNCKNCAYAGFEIICRTYNCINQSKWEIKEK